jgi:hypothetical protein
MALSRWRIRAFVPTFLVGSIGIGIAFTVAASDPRTGPAAPFYHAVGQTDVSGGQAPAGPAPERRCAHIAPPVKGGRGPRLARTRDLLELRDFGGGGLDATSPPGFAVSPSGNLLAVQVRQADPENNAYCQALLVFDLTRRIVPPAVIPLGSELSRQSGIVDGLADFQFGTANALTPRWSPDGRWLAFVQRTGGVDGLHLARPDGGGTVVVAAMKAGVTAFEWSDHGTALKFTTDEALRDAQQKLIREGARGYRYDERFWIESETDPHPRGTFAQTRYSARISATGAVGPLVTLKSVPQSANRYAPDRAWVAMDDTPRFAYRSRPRVEIGGIVTSCMDERCEYAEGAWLIPGSPEVVFVRREGVAQADTAIYRWRVGKAAPVRIVRTSDALAGCQLAPRRLFCARERSAYPRDIVSIELETGMVRQVIDLNPEWKTMVPVRIHRLHWKNKFGIPAIGDLVIPAKKPAGPIPLVVVQYSTRGFLRGGTGDEYPIRPLVEAGFAVLSVSRPLDYNIWLARQGKRFSQRQLALDWTDRASVHDSLLAGLREAKRYVAVDSNHIAITGLSDGASAATYALIHSRIFSLALLSTCCEDPEVFTTAVGPAYGAFLADNEYPVPWELHKDSWRKVSLAMNAEAICAEIQMQLADREVRLSLTSFTKLRQAGIPMEMYVFPDEYHVKWQPAHRLAVYDRNMDKLAQWRSKPPVACFRHD